MLKSLLLTLVTLLFPVLGRREIVYFMSAEDVEWDYAPYGRDLVFNHQSEANQRIKTGEDRIGSKYSKAIYKLYRDPQYTVEVKPPPYHGFVGPTLRAEVGDAIIVHFRNIAFQCNCNLSVHPHGLFYTKKHEGALYLDGSSDVERLDDSIPPGYSFTYVWNITDSFGPTSDDDNCVMWGYHSHVNSMVDIETGLVGVLLTCRPGTLTSDQFPVRKDVTKEIVLYTDITDETTSYYIEQNTRRCLNPTLCMDLLRRKDKKFRESNRMYHINGYVYGNMPQLELCEGEEVAMYIYGLGNGMHTMQIYGQTFLIKNHRMDGAPIYPATFTTANMVPVNPGTWLLVCRNNEHLHDGMTAFVNVQRCRDVSLADTPPGRLKRYYIAAEDVVWNYMPGGKDLFAFGKIDMDHGFSSNSHHHMHHGDHHDSLGNTYRKAVFVEYEDDTFSQMKPRLEEEEHLHMLGPPIKVEVGDVVEVVFLNKASRPYSLFPHGVALDKSMEGAVYYTSHGSDAPYGRIAQPGNVTLYRFHVPWTAAPTLDDANCLSYTYHSSVDLRKDTNTGLIGPLLVCKPGSLDKDNKQIHVNREVYLLFSVIDENVSWYIDQTIAEFAPEKQNLDKSDEAFKHGNLVHAINGRIFGTLNGIEMCLGDRVSWHFIGLGSNKDLHGVGIQGNTMAVNGRTVDTRIIIPGIGFTGYMHPDNVGKWALYCHTHHHLMAGMTATYSVNVCRSQSLKVNPMKPSGAVRRYYIAAVEIEWDYAPSGMDKILGEPLGDPKAHSYKFTRTKGGFLGTKYKKAVYREYTDASFKYEKKRGYREIHLGLLGPYIRGEVGDVIEVVFKNMASHPFSIKVHGVFYNKQNEGMKYNDQSRFTDDNEVQPGKQYTYRWTVPERAGPGPNEPNCIGWLYHSGTNMVRDIPTGLMGPLITCRRGVLDPRNRRLDHHTREFAVSFYILNENRSWYIRENMRRLKDETAPHIEFEESNLMNSINGYVYGNTPGMVMEKGEHITWYLYGEGSEDDYHPIHFHGEAFIHKTNRSHTGDTIEVFPGTYETVDMLAENPGTWLLHCHVMEHLVSGMEAKYAVLPRGALKPLEDAEKDRVVPFVLHKLPYATAAGRYGTNSTSLSQSPPIHSTVLITPPGQTSNLPIIANNLNRVIIPPTNFPSQRRIPPSGSGGNMRVVANPALMDLYRSGILPDHWQIQTIPTGQTSVPSAR